MTTGPVRHNAIGPNVLEGWEYYRSDRYGFEFLYPSDWATAPLEQREQADGEQAFVNPEMPTVKIRGWATHLSNDAVQGSATSEPTEDSPTPDMEMNFVTEQGMAGNLNVHSGSEMSSITLTLFQNDRVYKWQGEAPRGEFASFYQLFTYIANQYRIPPDAE